MATSAASITYGALLALGGTVGFVRAGSTASLLGGGLGGAFFAASELLLSRSPQLVVAVSAAQALAAGGLAYVMGGRYSASGKFMPAGLVASLSLILCVVYSARALTARGGR